MAFNLFEAPEYYQGLLGEDATKKLQNRALTTGLINAAIGYIAQPKTQGFGSALPYLGRALAGGLQAGQETIKSGLTDYETQQKIAEMQRQRKAREAFDTASQNLYTTKPAQFETVSTPGGYAPQQAQVMPDQVSPNFGMTRLPDVTSQREIAPAKKELNQEALMQLALSGDPRAKTYVDTLVAMKDLNPQAKPRPTQIAPNGQLIYTDTGEPVTQQSFAAPEKGTSKQQDYNFYASQETKAGRNPKTFADWDMSIESARAPKSTVTVAMPAPEKAILEVDQDTLKGLTANANSARSVASQTRTINSLIGNQQGSGAIKLNADLQNFLGITSKEANVNQAVTAIANKAATEIRTPGSGSTSDLEFGAYRAAFPSLATSRQGRELMVQIAEANAKRNSKLADWARVNVKQGTFSYDNLNAYDASLGRAVSVDIENKVKALTGGNKPGANQDLFNQADAIIGGGKR
jgi:hypothetical protein